MRYNILAIDDSKVVRKILKQAFSNYDCSVFEGANGQDGLEVALKVHPDLIILDIDMPIMNGWDTLGSLRFDEDLKETPVIMLTANADEKNVERAEALGAVDFLKKPFKSEQIIQHAKKFIDLSAE